MDISESQSLLMETLPQWNHYIARPFKRFLDEGMSPPMFHGMQRLRQSDSLMTMTEKRRIFNCTNVVPVFFSECFIAVDLIFCHGFIRIPNADIRTLQSAFSCFIARSFGNVDRRDLR